MNNFKIDEYGLVLKKDGGGKGDCIGRTFEAYVAYNDERFIGGIWACWYPTYRWGYRDYYWQGYRHPSYYDKEKKINTISRDHVLNSLIAFRYSGRYELFDAISGSLRWKLSDRYSQTIDMWLWIKYLRGSTLAGIAYYLIVIPMTLGSAIWNKLLYKIAGFKGERSQDEFKYYRKEDLTKLQLWCRENMFPMYAIHNTSWQSQVIPDSFGKWLMKRCLRLLTPKSNLLVSLLLDRKVSREQIYSYKPMTKDRWTTRLDETDDRGTELIPGAKEEDRYIDRDILRAVWEKKS